MKNENLSSKNGNPLFEIKDLYCGYPSLSKTRPGKQSNSVLHIGSLTINKGEFVVLLGNSGSGKSTLLETLGLMANRIVSGEIRYFADNNSIISYAELWNYSEENKNTTYLNNPKVTRVRRDNFNFIFQENNLMHNLTNAENIVIADLIDTKKISEESFEDAQGELKLVNLPEEFGNRFPRNISGGERQRVAFARATQPDFEVLFGDEPTGNLDEKNAGDLMEIIKNKISTHPDKTAIIVTHNIELALKYADRIILITPSSGNSYYEIIEDHILVKTLEDTGESHFHKLNNGQVTESDEAIRSEINKLLIKSTERKVNADKEIPLVAKPRRLTLFISAIGLWLMKIFIGFSDDAATNTAGQSPGMPDSRLKLPKAFASLFFRKECDQLLGHKNRNFYIFTLALLITLLIVGFAGGQLNSLENELKDPFVNTVDVLHKGGDAQAKIDAVIAGLINDSTNQNFGIDTIYCYNTFSFPFIDYSGEYPRTTYLDGRSIPWNDPMLQKIISAEQNAIGRAFNSPNENGIIITRGLLAKLGYDENTSFLELPRKPDGNEYYIPIPVLAIVDHIPESKYIGKNYFLCTPNFYDNYRGLGNKFLIEENERLRIIFTKAKTNDELLAYSNNTATHTEESPSQSLINTIEPALDSALEELNHSFQNQYECTVFTQAVNLSGLAHTIEVSLTRSPPFQSFGEQVEFFDQLIQQKTWRSFVGRQNTGGQNIEAFHAWYSNTVNNPYKQTRDNIAINFNSTGHIRDFSETFKQATQLEMDMAKVENMQTFFRVSSMTNTILLILIAFGVVAIMLYIYNLMNMHLYRIRKNIGTLKAFGVEPIPVFKVLTLTYVSVGILFSGILAAGLDLILYQAGIPGFSLITSPRALQFLFITLALIYFGAWLVYRTAQKKYFNQNPSDLIYAKGE